MPLNSVKITTTTRSLLKKFRRISYYRTHLCQASSLLSISTIAFCYAHYQAKQAENAYPLDPAINLEGKQGRDAHLHWHSLQLSDDRELLKGSKTRLH